VDFGAVESGRSACAKCLTRPATELVFLEGDQRLQFVV
jgi:hypothetical protein